MATRLAIYCILIAITAVHAEEKTPVPDAAAQKAAEKTIKDLFKADYAKAAPTDKLALAQKLMEQGATTNDDVAAKFILLREARDIAAQFGDATLACRAVDERARVFDVDAVEEKTLALAKAESATRSPEAFKALAERYLELIDASISADKFDVAQRLSSKVEAAARNSQQVSLVNRAKEKAKSVVDIQREVVNAKAAMKTLKENPADPAANTAVGKFLCFSKGDWEKGGAMLAKGNDAVLKTVGEMEAAKPADASSQLARADEWWDLAEKQTGAMKAAFKKRALWWYNSAAPAATGLAQTKAYTRIDSYEQSVNAADPRFVNLLPLVDVKKDGAAGTWKLDGGQLISTSKEDWVEVDILYQPPEEYDFRVVFTRLEDGSEIHQYMYRSNHQFLYMCGGRAGKTFGFQTQSKNSAEREASLDEKSPLLINRRYTSVVQVRHDVIRAFLDDQLITERQTDSKSANIFSNSLLKHGTALGIGTAWGPVSFQRIELIEMSGKGTKLNK